MIEKKHRPYTRDELAEAIRRLPDDASIRDALERLYFLRNVEIARAQLAAGDSFTQDEIEREMAEWDE